MLKTNSKAARENIRAWIMDNSSFEIETPAGTFENVTYNDFPTTARAAWDCFINEYMRDDHQRRYNLRMYKTWQECFIQWLHGLPSAIDSAAYMLGCDSAKNTLAAILEETDAERDRYSETDAERFMSYLIYREVSKYATA